MKNRKRLAGLIALGVAAAVSAPTTGALAATKKTTAPKKTTTKKAAPKATPSTAAAAATTAAPAASSAPAAASGGKIVFGLEAESSEGYLPASSQWAISGHQVSYAMIERLAGVTETGKIIGVLAESITPNPTYTSWTIKVRPGIKFHNGEDLNADAVVQNLKSTACGSITLTSFIPVNAGGAACAGGGAGLKISATGPMTVEVGLFLPWVSYPSYLSGQGGAIIAPAQLKANNRNAPIGTGPFKFKEWQVGVKLVATKNENYWQKGLPKLDEIEFRPIVDESARVAQLQSGQIDMTHTSNWLTKRELDDLAKAGKIKVTSSEAFGEVSYLMLNVAKAPFDNRDCRLALAYGQDVETLIKARAPGAVAADGPFPKGALGFLAKSGYPAYNLDKAKESYAKCKATAGGGRDVSFTLGTTNVPDNLETAQLQKLMFEKVGFNVNLTQIEQQRYIGVALVGAFDAFQWRNHGGVDPDQQRVWWHTETAAPIDGKTIALNFGRIKDGQIDAALDLIRKNSDPAVRKKAAEAINQQFAEQAYNLWTWRTRWNLAYGTKVGGIDDVRTITGEKPPLLPSGHFAGLGFLTKG
jgi:peptide/nickel transport system substrate-binding protein